MSLIFPFLSLQKTAEFQTPLRFNNDIYYLKQGVTTKEFNEEELSTNIKILKHVPSNSYFSKIDEETIITFARSKRTSALQKTDKVESKIIIFDNNKILFEETMTLRNSLDVTELNEGLMDMKDEENSLKLGREFIKDFPNFMLKIVKTASFDLSIESFEEFDTMLKINLFSLLINFYLKMMNAEKKN